MSAASLDFSGRRVLVTGGGRGIGKAVAIKFLELNATVFVLEKDNQLLQDLATKYPSITALHVDLSDWNATRSAFRTVLPIHHLVNNAAIAPTIPFLQIDSAHMDKYTALITFVSSVYEVNFKAALNVAQVVAQGMIDHEIKDGTIVSAGSVADSLVFADFGVYSAFKAALTMLTKTMSVELAPYGIRVNYVRACATATELTAEMPQDFKHKMFGPTLQRMVFHEFISTEDIANAFVFLSSSLSRSVTGIALPVDQGYTAR